MQIETRDTITAEQLKAEQYPMELACNPLGKLEFIADTIRGLCAYCQDPIEITNPSAMADIIADATMELWAVVNAGMSRIDALEAQLKACRAVADGKPHIDYGDVQ